MSGCFSPALWHSRSLANGILELGLGRIVTIGKVSLFYMLTLPLHFSPPLPIFGILLLRDDLKKDVFIFLVVTDRKQESQSVNRSNGDLHLLFYSPNVHIARNGLVCIQDSRMQIEFSTLVGRTQVLELSCAASQSKLAGSWQWQYS